MLTSFKHRAMRPPTGGTGRQVLIIHRLLWRRVSPLHFGRVGSGLVLLNLSIHAVIIFHLHEPLLRLIRHIAMRWLSH